MPPVDEKQSRQDLYEVAIYQKAILLCILGEIIAAVMLFLIAPDLKFIAWIFIAAMGIASGVFVFLLALKVYSLVIGIILAVFTMVPYIGILFLLAINQKATGILNKYGYKVGLLGASLAKINKEKK